MRVERAQDSLPTRGWFRLRLLPGVSLLMVLFGCGPSLYTAELIAAEQRLASAREENGRWYAPYEYHFAEVHLAKAREEAAEASYEEAIRFAKTASEFSERAREIARRERASQR